MRRYFRASVRAVVARRGRGRARRRKRVEGDVLTFGAFGAFASFVAHVRHSSSPSPPPSSRASWTIDDDAVRVAVDRPRGAAVDDTDVDVAACGDGGRDGGRGVGGAARGRRGRVRGVDDDARSDASWSSRYDARARGWVFGLRRRVGQGVCQG